jgi:hypothetical protein
MKIRFLLLHDESDCLFEVTDPTEADSLLFSGEVVDVTGDPEWEEKFKNQEEVRN